MPRTVVNSTYYVLLVNNDAEKRKREHAVCAGNLDLDERTVGLHDGKQGFGTALSRKCYCRRQCSTSHLFTTS
ncbi:hypothetical protein AAFF_G00003480 [Aldrovandia affinis]|uniref:Uncharacterized protein n=1 Tax=Aldrovandia affinis TaxID=143900 RepID=A0AAD7TD92_9TELE|nr:hypothetical protein AAFF_G00003480 [Aldrovandia affinis]